MAIFSRGFFNSGGMKSLILGSATLFLFQSVAYANNQSEEYRLIDGICAKRSGEDSKTIIPGFNQKKFGICGEFQPNRFFEVESKGIVLDGISLYRSSLAKVRFENASFRHAYLKQVRIFRSKFIKTDAFKINLRGSAIRKSAMSRSDFTDADMRGIKVWQTRFDFAILKGANLSTGYFHAVDFKEADLRDANFSGSVFIACSFVGAKINQGSKFPFTQAEAIRMGMILD